MSTPHRIMLINRKPQNFLIPFYLFCVAPVQIATRVIESVTQLIENEECISGEYKYMVSITDGQLNHYCDGSVLNSLWILTAAHCLRTKKDMRVRATVTENDPNGQVLTVQSTHTKPRYDGKELTYDVGMIKLSSKIIDNAENDRFRYTPIPYKIWTRLSCLNALSYTWIHSNKTALRCTELSIVPVENCTDRYRSLDRRATLGKNSTICVTSKFGREACKGKSGGPLFCNGMGQIGILYWHTGCTDEQYQGIYIRVDAHQGWISNMLREGRPRQRAKNRGCEIFVSGKLMLAGLLLLYLGKVYVV